MKRIFLVLLFCFVTIISCKKEKSTNTLIRISNKSAYQFENIAVNSSSYRVVKQGQNSAYVEVDAAYRYPNIKLTAGNKEFTRIPIEYIIQKPLMPGKYTYSLNISDFDAGSLQLDFQKD